MDGQKGQSIEVWKGAALNSDAERDECIIHRAATIAMGRFLAGA